MDPAMLATTVTSLLAPYLAKAGGAILDRAAAGLPDAASHLWEAVMKRFEGNPAAAGAATDMAKNASDQDRQEAFQLQLKMALKNDPEFASAVQELVKKAGGDTDNSTHINIQTGNVSGSAFVIGNNNNVKSG
jgi:poly-gamma-glutamate capsule biosynthesis protein CapA/YwtB (metallophosphatase superfamily)